jgi:hypothetical protein
MHEYITSLLACSSEECRQGWDEVGYLLFVLKHNQAEVDGLLGHLARHCDFGNR